MINFQETQIRQVNFRLELLKKQNDFILYQKKFLVSSTNIQSEQMTSFMVDETLYDCRLQFFFSRLMSNEFVTEMAYADKCNIVLVFDKAHH